MRDGVGVALQFVVGAAQLLGVVNACIRTQQMTSPGYYRHLTAEEFVMCGTDVGIQSCVFQEANEEAADHPNECDVTIN